MIAVVMTINDPILNIATQFHELAQQPINTENNLQRSAQMASELADFTDLHRVSQENKEVINKIENITGKINSSIEEMKQPNWSKPKQETKKPECVENLTIITAIFAVAFFLSLPAYGFALVNPYVPLVLGAVTLVSLAATVVSYFWCPREQMNV